MITLLFATLQMVHLSSLQIFANIRVSQHSTLNVAMPYLLLVYQSSIILFKHLVKIFSKLFKQLDYHPKPSNHCLIFQRNFKVLFNPFSKAIFSFQMIGYDIWILIIFTFRDWIISPKMILFLVFPVANIPNNVCETSNWESII